MKKTLLLTIAIVSNFIITAQESKFMTFKAEITNPSDTLIKIYSAKNNRKPVKTIKANEKGVFTDTLNITPDRYFFVHGKEFTPIYLKNGFDLTLKVNTKMFDETILYTGKGADENNYLAQNLLFNEQISTKQTFSLEEDDFKNLIERRKNEELRVLKSEKLDPYFVEIQTKHAETRVENLAKNYTDNKNLLIAKSKLNNSTAPSFNYENHKGGKTKLEDFKGKYVYIDVWATWCGPCRAEIPALSKIEKEFHDKNIAFVSISIDDLKNHDKWKDFVTKENLGGVQLLADNNWNSDFMKTFVVKSIPRFILIDPKGKVIENEAPRPSNPELQEKLEALLN